MKKLLLVLAGATSLFVASCHKEDEFITQEVQASWPTITFTAPPFVSINTGGTIPTVSPTSYDSVLNESYPVTIIGQDEVDNTTPGLYIVQARAVNKYGYVTLENVLVAVTNVPAASDLSGDYKRTDVGTGDVSVVEKLANGLYSLDNLAGANRVSRPDLLFPVYFVQVDDSTLVIPAQTTAVGDVSVEDENGVPDQAIYRATATDTTYKYAITSPSNLFGPAVRTFTKQ